MSATATSVSIRDQILPVTAGKTAFEMLRMIGTCRVEAAVDLNDSLPYLRLDDGSMLSIGDDSSITDTKAKLDAQGIQISALLLATDLSGDEAERHIDWASRIIHAAGKLGVPVVRIDPWTAKRELPPLTIRDNFARGTLRILNQTAATGVDIGMENHGDIFNDPALLDDVLAAIPDPRFGLTLDTGNLYWWGHPIREVYRLVDLYAPRTKHTHIKSIHYPPGVGERQREIGFEYKQFCCPLYEGDLDLKRLVNALCTGGYCRDFCVEDESLFKLPESERVEVLRRDVESLRETLR
jgi:sugar phosphate isomerase/epimerase